MFFPVSNAKQHAPHIDPTTVLNVSVGLAYERVRALYEDTRDGTGRGGGGGDGDKRTRAKSRVSLSGRLPFTVFIDVARARTDTRET